MAIGQKIKLETHSEEVQEIMGYIPSWIVRWGITFFFFIFLSIAVGSYFFKYPAVVSSPFILTTINPPAPVISKKGGRIDQWYVSDGQDVEPGTVIALLENAANYNHLELLNNILVGLERNWQKEVKSIDLPGNLSLGVLQNTYLNFQKTYRDLNYYLRQDLVEKKINLLESRILNHEEQYDLVLKQWELKKEEFDLAKDIYLQDSAIYFMGGYGVIKTDYERSLQTFFTRKSSLLSFEASIRDTENTLLQLKESLLELKLKRENDLNTFRNTLDEAFTSLQTQTDEWFASHVLTSPIKGKITMTNYWSENQVIEASERLATVVPREETIIIARAFVSSSNLGKVEAGQKVNIKLSGFPYMEYGVLNGHVKTVSLVPAEEGYIAEIELVKGMESSYKEKLKFIQQMDGTADIITENTRLVYKFINPLRALFNN